MPNDETPLPACFTRDPETSARTWAEIPGHLRPGLARYFNAGIIPGSFLSAVIQNDFCAVMQHSAPDITTIHLIVLALLMVCAPVTSTGSATRMLDYSARLKNEPR